MIKPVLDKLVLTMNTKRTNFDLPSTHKIHITSKWLLGFEEGDGSFYYDISNSRLVFSIGQKGNFTLMNAIWDFLHNLASGHGDVVHVYYTGDAGILQVINTDFIKEVIIPSFSSMTLNKKSLDYLDWVTIFNILPRS